MMATDDKVAFYLRHRTLIEEWAALREQAAAELEEALNRAVGIIGQRPDTSEMAGRIAALCDNMRFYNLDVVDEIVP